MEMGSHMRLLSWPASRSTRCTKAGCRDAAVCPFVPYVAQLQGSARSEPTLTSMGGKSTTTNRHELDKTGKSLQQDRLRRRHCITFSRVSARAGQLSVDLGSLKAGLYQAAHRAGVSPSVLARKAIAVLVDPTTSESGAEVSQRAPRASVERGKPEGKVLEVRVKLREEDAGRASECARAEGLSRSEYLAVLGGEAMREVAKRAGTA